MPRMPLANALAVLSALIAVPVIIGPGLAQQPAPPTAAPGAPNAAAPGATAPPTAGPAASVVPAGRLQQTHGGWRSSRIVDASVYTDSNQSIGTIDDLIVGQDGKVSTAVISVGGFLGIGSKLVGVPYDQLRFEERTLNETATAANAPPGTTTAPAAAPGATTTVGAPNGAAPTMAPGVGAGAVPTGAVTAGTAPSPAMPGPNATTTRIVLTGASKDSLTAMATFSYGP